MAEPKRKMTKYSDELFFVVMRHIREGRYNLEIVREYPELNQAVVSYWRKKYGTTPADKLPDFKQRYCHGRPVKNIDK
jgi:hypothetical protein